MIRCDRCAEEYPEADYDLAVKHNHPDALTKVQLHDALVLCGYSDTHAWTIADQAFSVSAFDISACRCFDDPTQIESRCRCVEATR